MYASILLAHSWIRWIALIAAFASLIAIVRDRSGEAGDRITPFFVMALDVQLLLGLLLYMVVSPNMQAVREHFGEAMKVPQLRFWAVEHIGAMLLSVVLAHVGRVIARRAPSPEARRTRLLITLGLATLLMLGGIPWPGMAAGRPLFRF